MRELILKQIQYWEERQSGHCQTFYERRLPAHMPKKEIHNWKGWALNYWASLSDEEFVNQFSFFMMRQGRMM